MTDFEIEIKKFIIEVLNLEDVTPDDIDSNTPIFGAGLGLDSIDALEIGVALKKKYNVTFNTDDSLNRQHFASISSLAKFVQENRRD